MTANETGGALCDQEFEILALTSLFSFSTRKFIALCLLEWKKKA